MVSAKDKGKEPMEEDLQDPRKEKEIKSEGEEEQGQHPHTSTTIASIGVVTKPARVRRTARMQTGGKLLVTVWLHGHFLHTPRIPSIPSSITIRKRRLQEGRMEKESQELGSTN